MRCIATGSRSYGHNYTIAVVRIATARSLASFCFCYGTQADHFKWVRLVAAVGAAAAAVLVPRTPSSS